MTPNQESIPSVGLYYRDSVAWVNLLPAPPIQSLPVRHQTEFRSGLGNTTFLTSQRRGIRVLRTVRCSATQNRFRSEKVKKENDNSRKIHLGFSTVSESRDSISLEVLGQLPWYLGKSAYYRNGPGLFEVKHKDGQDYVPEHWFDVISMVHAFFIDAENGAVEHRSRRTSDGFVRAIESVRKDRYVAVNVSHHYQPKSRFDRLLKIFGPMTKDPHTREIAFNSVVSLKQLPRKGCLNARTDANIIHRLDPETLDTLEVYDFTQFNSQLKESLSCAHGIYDSSTGEYFNYMSEYGAGKVDYKVFRIDPSGKGEILSTFKDYTYYLHSFSLTKNYVIMILWPCHVNLFKLLADKSFAEACQMKPGTNTTFVVISRNTNQIVAKYQHDPFFCFHTIAAFEDGDDIAIDLSKYEDHSILTELRLENLISGKVPASAIPVRFTLSSLSDAISAGPETTCPRADYKVLADVHLDMPVVAPDKALKPYRYAYGISNAGCTKFMGDLIKLDTQNGKYLTWSTPHSFTGEPVFVPNPHGTDEDDGCILALILDTADEKSFLVVLDAHDMTEIARAVVPKSLPLGFHGTFIPDHHLQKS